MMKSETGSRANNQDHAKISPHNNKAGSATFLGTVASLNARLALNMASLWTDSNVLRAPTPSFYFCAASLSAPLRISKYPLSFESQSYWISCDSRTNIGGSTQEQNQPLST